MADSTIPSLPNRPADAHKGTFGRAMIVAGSVGMSGAAALAGMAALRSGAGLVYLAVPEPVLPVVASYNPSYLTIPLVADVHGRISKEAFAALEGRLANMDAAAIGPGLGRSEDLDHIVAQLYRTDLRPLVVDADALNALVEQPELLMDHAGVRVLTPHPGEFAKLVDKNIQDIQANRLELAVDFASKHNAILILKGSGTIVTDGIETYINQTGNAGMATGGSGDVLTGMITSLIAQGMEPFPASKLAVHAHGLAADIAVTESNSQQALIASDLVDFLAKAWAKIEAS